jgi:phosphate transport system substrate-binding protein
MKGIVSAALGMGVLGFAGAARAQDKTIRIDGSSTVYPITEAVAEDFQAKNKDIKVTVGISGTGGGMKKFVRGDIDIADASRPIKKDEMAQLKQAGIGFIELPIAFDALTVVINPQNNWVKELTVEDLKKMWAPESQGKVMTWKDVRPEWPEVPLKLYGPGADSGTFEYFTEAINHKAKASRTDYTPSEDDNVLVQGVAGDKGALGYFGYAYYAENKAKLKAVPIVNPKTGKAVEPSKEAVEDAVYVPLARPIFIYVNSNSIKRPEVRKFVEFYLSDGPDKVEQVKYVALPTKAYKMGMDRVEKNTLGTVFASGETVGVSIEELLKKEAQH